jgi:hypothetical protein
MKKVMICLAVATALFSSCKKDEICNCGEIISDDATTYSVDIRNECSGNVKKFYLSESDWMTAYVGSNYCITNVQSW